MAHVPFAVTATSFPERKRVGSSLTISGSILALGLVLLGWHQWLDTRRRHQQHRPHLLRHIFVNILDNVAWLLIIWSCSTLFWDILQQFPRTEQGWLVVLVLLVGLSFIAGAVLMNLFLKKRREVLVSRGLERIGERICVCCLLGGMILVCECGLLMFRLFVSSFSG